MDNFYWTWTYVDAVDSSRDCRHLVKQGDQQPIYRPPEIEVADIKDSVPLSLIPHVDFPV